MIDIKPGVNKSMLDDRVNPDRMITDIDDSWKKPISVARSAFIGFTQGATESSRLLDNAIGYERQDPAKQSMDVMNMAMSKPSNGWPQETANFVGNVAGMMTDRANIALGFGAGAIAEEGIAAAAKFLPESILSMGEKTSADLLGEKLAKRAPEFIPKTLGNLGKDLTKTFAEASAVSIPMAFNENFNEKTGKFDIIGGATQSLKYGALGMGIHTLGMASGVVYGKIRLSKDFKTPKMGDSSRDNISEVNKAFEDGKINKDEHEWAHTYLSDPNNTTKLNELAVKILKSEKYNVDSSTNEVFMQLASKEAIDNLHLSIFEQLASNATGDLKTAMSDYINSNIMDEMKNDSGHMINGLKGYVSYMDHRLEMKLENLSKFKKVRDKSNYPHITNDHPMSQRSIFKYIRQGKYDEKLFPHAIPKELRERFNQEQKATNLSNTYQSYRKKIKRGEHVSDNIREKISNIDKKIDDIKSNLTKLLNPSNELKNLEEHFLSKDELPNNFQLSNEYQRLKDLSLFSEKAAALLHHVDLVNNYDVAGAYKGMIDTLSKLMDGDIEKYAQPEKLNDYIKNKIGQNVDGFRDSKANYTPVRKFRDRREDNDIEDLEDEAKDNVDHSEEFLKDNDVDVMESGSEDFEKDNKESKNMYKQFKAKISTMKNLVSCTMGIK